MDSSRGVPFRTLFSRPSPTYKALPPKRHGNAMSRPPRTHTLTAELAAYRAQLDTACRRRWGVSGGVYRALDRLYNILVLCVTVIFLVETEVEPIYAMAFAVVLIAGAEGIQSWVMNATDPGGESADGDK